MTDAPKIVLTPFGDPDAEVCVDGVCEVPPRIPGS